MCTERSRFGIAVLLVAVLAAGCSSSDEKSQPSTSQGSTAPIPPAPEIPAPPSALAVTPVEPSGQAELLAPATAPGSPDVLAGWLTAYDLAKIPVLVDNAPIGTTGDDPLGPEYWRVWSLSDATANPSVSLVDAMRIIAGGSDPVPEEAEMTEAAQALVSDLATAAASDSTDGSFIAKFLDAKVQRRDASSSLFDPELDVAETRLDIPTVQFLSWVVLRAAALPLAALPDGVETQGLKKAETQRQSARTVSRQVGEGEPCSEQSWRGGDQMAFVANWIVNKLASGVKIGGLELPNFLERYVSYLARGNELVQDKIAVGFEKWGRIAGKVNLITSVLSLLLQYESMTVAGEVPELVRTKSTSDGAKIDVRVEIWNAPPKEIPDPDSPGACALAFLGNIAGVGFSLPKAGPIPELEIAVKPGKSIPSRVLFNSEVAGGGFRQTADKEGGITVPLIGRAQKKQLPDSAKREELSYSLWVSATPEPVNGNSMFNVLFGGAVAVTTINFLNAAGSAIDILKTMTIEVGELEGDLVDWVGPQQYSFTGTTEGAVLEGRICSLEEPFTGTASNAGFTMDLTFTPTASLKGTLLGSLNTGGVSVTNTGTYSLDTGEEPSISMTVEYGQGSYQGHTAGSSFADTVTFALIPITC